MILEGSSCSTPLRSPSVQNRNASSTYYASGGHLKIHLESRLSRPCPSTEAPDSPHSIAATCSPYVWLPIKSCSPRRLPPSSSLQKQHSNLHSKCASVPFHSSYVCSTCTFPFYLWYLLPHLHAILHVHIVCPACQSTCTFTWVSPSHILMEVVPFCTLDALYSMLLPRPISGFLHYITSSFFICCICSLSFWLYSFVIYTKAGLSPLKII